MSSESAENKTADRTRIRSCPAEHRESFLRRSLETSPTFFHPARRRAHTRIARCASPPELSSALGEHGHCLIHRLYSHPPDAVGRRHNGRSEFRALHSGHPLPSQNRRRPRSLLARQGYIPPLSCAHFPRMFFHLPRR